MSVAINESMSSKDDLLFDSPQYKPVIKPAQDLYPSSLTYDSIQQAERLLNTVTLDQRVTLLSTSTDSKYSTYSIDHALKVKVPSDQFRLAMAKYWEDRCLSSTRNSWASGLATVFSTIGTVIAAKRNDPMVIAVFAISSIASFVFAAFQAYWASKASYQKEGWEISPAHKIAEERKTAFERGFKYAYDNDLKLVGSSNHAVLLPQEVEYLFNNYFDQFCRHLLTQNPVTDQQKKEWVDQFRNYNPISKELLEYAYSGSIPFKYVQVSADFENMAAFLKNLRNEFDQLRDQRCRETENIIKSINTKRDLALMPFNIMLTHWKEEAKNTRDKELAKLDISDQKRREQVEKEYQLSVSQYHLYYAAAVTPVHAYFDGKVKEARRELNQILKEIKRNEASSTAVHFNYAWGLLSYAEKMKNDQGFAYQAGPFVPLQALHIPEPSAPPLEEVDFIEIARSQQHPQNIASSQYDEYLKFINQSLPSAPQWWQ